MSMKSVQLGKISKDEARVHPVLKSHISYCLYKSAVKLRALIDEELEGLKLIAPHHAILRVLEAEGAMSQVILGHNLCIDKATMVSLIDLLEGRGLVKRDSSPKDRRIKQVSLTKKGADILVKSKKARDSAEAKFFSPLSAHEKESLRAIISKLI